MTDIKAGGHEFPVVDFEGAPIVGVASVMYSDPEDPRYGAALKTAEGYQEAGLPLVMVDASPESWPGDSFRERGATVVRAPRPGLATQYIDGITFAVDNGAEKVIRHEAEKTPMVQFAGEIAMALDNKDIVVIGRTPEALDSMPTTQARTEHVAGWILEQTLDMPADALSGGRGYNRRGAQELAEYPVDKYGNNWVHLYTPTIEGREHGVTSGSLAVDLQHPEAIVADEQGNEVFDRKRYDQFTMQLERLLVMPQLRPEAEALAQHVLTGIAEIKSGNPTNRDYEDYFTELEDHLADRYGYQPRR